MMRSVLPVSPGRRWLALSLLLFGAACGHNNGTPGPGPTGRFSAGIDAGGPYAAAKGIVINFRGSVTPGNALNASGLTFTWDFGDGASGVAGQFANHAYAAAGSYTVSLTVSDGNGV